VLGPASASIRPDQNRSGAQRDETLTQRASSAEDRDECVTRQPRWLTVDYENAITAVRFSDGMVASEALASAPASKEVRRLTYDVAKGWRR